MISRHSLRAGQYRGADKQSLFDYVSELAWDTAFDVEIADHKVWSITKNNAMEAMFRDIVRWRLGTYQVPNKEFEKCVEDFKRTDIWPKESDSSPDYFTGEVLYRPLSRRKLSPAQQDGIMNWLTHYMTENAVPSHHPQASGE